MTNEEIIDLIDQGKYDEAILYLESITEEKTEMQILILAYLYAIKEKITRLKNIVSRAARFKPSGSGRLAALFLLLNISLFSQNTIELNPGEEIKQVNETLTEEFSGYKQFQWQTLRFINYLSSQYVTHITAEQLKNNLARQELRTAIEQMYLDIGGYRDPQNAIQWSLVEDGFWSDQHGPTYKIDQFCVSGLCGVLATREIIEGVYYVSLGYFYQ